MPVMIRIILIMGEKVVKICGWLIDHSEVILGYLLPKVLPRFTTDIWTQFRSC